MKMMRQDGQTLSSWDLKGVFREAGCGQVEEPLEEPVDVGCQDFQVVLSRAVESCNGVSCRI